MKCGHRAWTVPRSREEKAKPARLALTTSAPPSQEKMSKKNFKKMKRRGVIAHMDKVS